METVCLVPLDKFILNCGVSVEDMALHSGLHWACLASNIFQLSGNSVPAYLPLLEHCPNLSSLQCSILWLLSTLFTLWLLQIDLGCPNVSMAWNVQAESLAEIH